MRSASKTARVAVAAFTVLVLAACTDSAESNVPTETVTVDISEVVNATSDGPVIAFSEEVASDSTVVLSATGVLDVAELRGFRSDSVGLDGTGLEPIGEVWLESGKHYQSIGGMTSEPANGGLASFLGTTGPQNLTSLEEVIEHWLGSNGPQRATRETVDEIVTTRFTLERSGRTALEVWIDSANRLVRVVEVGDQIRPLVSTHSLEYPETVTIPVRP